MKSLFIVPSCISFSPEIPLDYSDNRSVFSPEERFKQSLDTIASIRRYSPTSAIMLVEISHLDPKHKEILTKKCEHVISPDQRSVRIFDHFKNHANKSHGETFLILQALNALKTLQYPAYDLFFKLSGRYKINSDFKIENYVNNLFVAKKHYGFDSSSAIYTTLFSFSKDFFDLFWLNILWSFSITTNYLPPHKGYSLETNMLPYNSKDITFIDTLGVEGKIGPSGTLETS